MSASRPPSPPRASDVDIPISVEITVEPSSPKRSSSMDSASGAAPGRESKTTRKSAIEHPTNTLIIAPLPLPFFEPKILDALKSHFASFSTTFLHRRSPYSPVSALGPGASIGNGSSPQDEALNDAAQDPMDTDEVMEEQASEGDLYSFVPLKSFRRAIVVFYSAEDAERARIESDRLYIPETPKCPAVTLRAFRAPETVLVEESWFTGSGRNRVMSDDAEEGSWYFGGYPAQGSTNYDDTELKESPFHLRPPVPERNFLISPPGSPPVGWVAVREDPPNESPLAQDLMDALERVKAQATSRPRKRRRAVSDDRSDNQDRKRSRSVSTAGSALSTDEEDHSDLLIPEGASGLSVRVENWSTRQLMQRHQARELRRKGDKARAEKHALDILAQMEAELDQDLDDGRYSASVVDWNRIDHSRTVINTDFTEDGNVDQPRNLKLGQGRGTEVKMPNLGPKPKPASLPPVLPVLSAPVPEQYKPTALPPLRPTAMPPVRPESGAATASSSSLPSISSTTVEPSLTPRIITPGPASGN